MTYTIEFSPDAGLDGLCSLLYWAGMGLTNGDDTEVADGEFGPICDFVIDDDSPEPLVGVMVHGPLSTSNGEDIAVRIFDGAEPTDDVVTIAADLLLKVVYL